MESRRSPLMFLFSVLAAACGSSGASPQRGFGPIPVQIRRLAETQVADFDQYMASLTSRRSITLYPQVAGYVRAIRVHPGDHARTGDLLVAIDPGQQAAMLKSLDANLLTKRASLAYAVQNDQASRELVRAGLIGQLDYEQRHSQRLGAEADVSAAEAQVQAQAELLRFYKITAPSDGVVGDVPVKVGDYVNQQTRLTSVDQDKLVEAYVYVPISKANGVRPDTTIQLVDEGGKPLCEEKPSFISPQVNADTQTVLVKIMCPNEGVLRTAQVLQARVIWARRSAVTVPTAAVTRQSGQYFAFVVERGPQGAVARQKPIQVGTIQGNDFVVEKGLAQGTEVVISNVQKIRDGAPIAPQETGAAASAASNSPSPQPH